MALGLKRSNAIVEIRPIDKLRDPGAMFVPRIFQVNPPSVVRYIQKLDPAYRVFGLSGSKARVNTLTPVSWPAVGCQLAPASTLLNTPPTLSEVPPVAT